MRLTEAHTHTKSESIPLAGRRGRAGLLASHPLSLVDKKEMRSTSPAVRSFSVSAGCPSAGLMGRHGAGMEACYKAQKSRRGEVVVKWKWTGEKVLNVKMLANGVISS